MFANYNDFINMYFPRNRNDKILRVIWNNYTYLHGVVYVSDLPIYYQLINNEMLKSKI